MFYFIQNDEYWVHVVTVLMKYERVYCRHIPFARYSALINIKPTHLLTFCTQYQRRTCSCDCVILYKYLFSFNRTSLDLNWIISRYDDRYHRLNTRQNHLIEFAHIINSTRASHVLHLKTPQALKSSLQNIKIFFACKKQLSADWWRH